MKKFLPLLALSLVLLLGCIFPLTEYEQTDTFTFTASGGLKMISEMEGSLSSDEGQVNEWVGDCTSKVTGLVEMVLSMAETSGTSDENVALAKNYLNLYFKDFSCEFSKTGEGKGLMVFRYSFSKETLLKMNELAGKFPAESRNSMISFKEENGVYVFSIPLSVSAMASSAAPAPISTSLKEIRVKVEGELVELTPSGYVEREGFFVFTDPGSITEQKLVVKYKPSAFLVFFGGPLFLVFIVAAIIAVVLLAVFFLKKRKQKPKAFPKETKKAILKKPKEKKTKANPDYIKFIKEYRGKGYSEQEIIEAMVEAGLSKEEIKDAMMEAK